MIPYNKKKCYIHEKHVALALVEEVVSDTLSQRRVGVGEAAPCG